MKNEQKEKEQPIYVGLRLSMKQRKLYAATTTIQKLNEHKRKPKITNVIKVGVKL